MHTSMIANTTAARTGIAPANTRAEVGSMKNAMIMAPNTMKGERKKRRRTILIPACN